METVETCLTRRWRCSGKRKRKYDCRNEYQSRPITLFTQLQRLLLESRTIALCLLLSSRLFFLPTSARELNPWNYNYDCETCTRRGLHFCPGDATCRSGVSLPYFKFCRGQDNLGRCQPLETISGTTSCEEECIDACSDPSDFISDAGSCSDSSTYTNDPLYPANNWVYEMINVVPVWKAGYTGDGVTIRINDSGVDVTSTELSGRFDTVENSCEIYAASNSDHGTRVAGIILGNANNNHCAVGIAHEAKFSSCDIINTAASQSSILEYKLETFDISQNSYGVFTCGKSSNNDEDMQEDIIYDIGCRFTYSAPEYESDGPCNVCDGQFVSQDRSLSQECSIAIHEHCKKYFREDEYACLDFPDLLVDMYGLDCDYKALPDSYGDALKKGITQGRGGKGTIFVWASGNAFSFGDDVNFNGFTNSRFTISVGSVAKNGFHTDYSTPGAALVVSAPTGSAMDSGHVLTASLGDECTDSSIGTSVACPIVSGVIALMLQARPELTWRDVQGVLAQTSRRVEDSLDDSAMVNGAGIWHSNWYGFGIVNAKAAVDASLQWNLFTEEILVTDTNYEDGDGTVLSDNLFSRNSGNGFVSTIQIGEDDENMDDGFVTESTVIFLELSHYNRGDLEIELVSPSNTKSVMHPGKRPEDTRDDGKWKLMTVRNWGESPKGEWKLIIRDLVDREDNSESKPDDNVFKGWSLYVYGRLDPSNVPMVSNAPTAATKDDKKNKGGKNDKKHKTGKKGKKHEKKRYLEANSYTEKTNKKDSKSAKKEI